VHNENGVTETDPATLDATWFDATDHIGAVKEAANNWTEGLTVWIND